MGTLRENQLGLNILDFPRGPCVTFLACRKGVWDFKSVRREMGIAARALADSTRDQNVGVIETGLNCLFSGSSLSAHLFIAEEQPQKLSRVGVCSEAI